MSFKPRIPVAETGCLRSLVTTTNIVNLHLPRASSNLPQRPKDLLVDTEWNVQEINFHGYIESHLTKVLSFVWKKYWTEMEEKEAFVAGFIFIWLWKKGSVAEKATKTGDDVVQRRRCRRQRRRRFEQTLKLKSEDQRHPSTKTNRWLKTEAWSEIYWCSMIIWLIHLQLR